MRRMLIVSLILFIAGLAQAGGDSQADLKAMEGAWMARVEEVYGKPPSEGEKEVSFRVVVKAGKFTIFVGDKQVATGTLTLDAGKKPREIDAEQADGKHKGMVQKGLYEIKGDEMRLIFAEPGKDRPKEFKTRAGEMLLIYTRVKEAKKKK